MYLFDSASFQPLENNAPSKSRTKHLGGVLAQLSYRRRDADLGRPLPPGIEQTGDAAKTMATLRRAYNYLTYLKAERSGRRRSGSSRCGLCHVKPVFAGRDVGLIGEPDLIGAWVVASLLGVIGWSWRLSIVRVRRGSTARPHKPARCISCSRAAEGPAQLMAALRRAFGT